jgi:hypothetical protein
MADNAKRPGRGCFFYGTITFVLVLVGVLLGVYLGIRKATLVNIPKYTAAGPAPIPRLNLSRAEQDRMARELAQTLQRAAAGQGTEVALNEQDLNVILRQSPQIQGRDEDVYLQAEGDKLKAQMSVPLDQFEQWKTFRSKLFAGNLTNRYFNGTAFLSLEITNGAIKLTITNLVANGETLPREFTKWLEDQNFAQQANANAQLQAALQNVQDVIVTNSSVVVRFKK